MLFPSVGCLRKRRIRFRRTLCVEVGLIGVADRQCRLVLILILFLCLILWSLVWDLKFVMLW